MSVYQRSYQIDYFCGWRYVLSPSFRDQVRLKWGSNLIQRSLWMVGAVTSIMLTSAGAILLAMMIWYLIQN